MNRDKITSSTIKSVGYDESTKILEVEFRSGGTYQYENVPPVIYEILTLPKIVIDEKLTQYTYNSKGSFLHKNVKGFFNYKKI